MKKIFAIICFAAAILTSCNKFKVENTATVNLAGNWLCTIYYNDGTDWVPYTGCEVLTYNTAANLSSEIWIDDQKGFWGTACKIDASNADFSFGKEGKEYLDEYYGVGQMIWGGKVTVDGAHAPGTNSLVDKIEFFIAFADDSAPYSDAYYFVGYRRTGFPEDDDNYSDDWELPAIPEIPAVTEPLE